MGQRTVLITGGSRGIGAAIAEELAARGDLVVAPPRRDLDLSSTESVANFCRARTDFPVDILINNAGINVLNAIGNICTSDWQNMLQTNLGSVLVLLQAFTPGMRARGWGRVLNISSIFSLVTKEQRAAYSMTKAALNALTRSAAVEFGPDGVIVNSLAPGYVDTSLTRQNNSPDAIASIESAIPLRRLAQADELARVAAFLVSEDNTYLTGQTIVVDGGFTCQ
jgi:NAD(P)-dependent dehydrogenase (short-subunit alcohol dehydrogenase family)